MLLPSIRPCAALLPVIAATYEAAAKMLGEGAFRADAQAQMLALYQLQTEAFFSAHNDHDGSVDDRNAVLGMLPQLESAMGKLMAALACGIDPIPSTCSTLGIDADTLKKLNDDFIAEVQKQQRMAQFTVHAQQPHPHNNVAPFRRRGNGGN